MSADSAATFPSADAPMLARLALLAPAMQDDLRSLREALSGNRALSTPALPHMAAAMRMIGASTLAGLADEVEQALHVSATADDAASAALRLRIARLCNALSDYLDDVAAGRNPDAAALFFLCADLRSANATTLSHQENHPLRTGDLLAAQDAGAFSRNPEGDASLAVLKELQLDLMQIEHLLEISLAEAGSHANLGDVAGLLMRDIDLLATAGYDDIRNLIAVAHGNVMQLMAEDNAIRSAAPASQTVSIIAVLSLMVEWLLHTPDGRATPFVFEDRVTLPRLSLRSADAPATAIIAEPALSPLADATQDAPEEIDTELLEIFLQEADELLINIRHALSALHQAPEDEAQFVVLRRAFHTLKGSGRMVGLERLATAAMALENALVNWDANTRNRNVALLQRAGTELQDWLTDLHRHGQSECNGRDLLAAIENVSAMPQRAAPLVPQVLPAIPTAAVMPASQSMLEEVGTLGISAELHRIYLQETTQLLAGLLREVDACRDDPEVYRISAKTLRTVHSIKSSSATVGFGPLQTMAQSVEAFLQGVERLSLIPNQAQCETLSLALQTAQSMLLQFATGVMPAPNETILSALAAMSEALPPHTAPERAPGAAAVDDSIDQELLPIFLEEGRDLLPQIGEGLYKLQKNPEQLELLQHLLRPLHTVKGSARMAGAMRLGQHVHEMESNIETMVNGGSLTLAQVEHLLTEYDQGLQLFEALQHPEIADGLDGAGDDISSVAVEQAGVPANDGDAGRGQTSVPLVRIRANILDRLLNQAGELSISRSRLETEVDFLRESATELAANIGRLGAQLRKIEIQAEIQISASDKTLGEGRDFDPLEFDRFTHLQELTRMMAESVSDVSSLQKTLLGAVNNTQTNLVEQARLTRDLQQELMHARMVQFHSVEERLQRLVRQLSKETGKEFKLDITGSAVEIDRSILEKMIAPFEHLLRNAAVHGIEPLEQRLAARKTVCGHLQLDVRQEGNEVTIHMADDGRGLNLAHIREKADSLGMLAADAEISDIGLMELIFQPGFSTSHDVTALAGRGVGMDVVRSEVTSLGGRIAVDSVTGQGAQFIMHLPLTLAVTQVVLLTAGRKTYAIPSVLVEQVMQLKEHEQEQVFRDGAVNWQGKKITLHYMSVLLGDSNSTPLQQSYAPVIFVKNGNELAAIMVDRIVGNREVVTKNIGPQLTYMIGVVGATVLGTGEIVLILNPIRLTQRKEYKRLLQQPAAIAIPALLRKKIIMVVDDSQTVRRVMQRLLTRESYEVVLATDGMDALRQLRETTPDLILLDIEMPRMDGFDFTRHIRDIDSNVRIPIIMITSRTAAKHRERAMELGVNAYLGKPYQEDMLLGLIRDFLEESDDARNFSINQVIFDHEALPGTGGDASGEG